MPIPQVGTHFCLCMDTLFVERVECCGHMSRKSIVYNLVAIGGGAKTFRGTSRKLWTRKMLCFEVFTHQEEITNLFVFNFEGDIVFSSIKYSDSWHKSKLAGVSGLYHGNLSYTKTPPGMAIFGESEFVNNTGSTNGKVVRARNTNETCSIPESAALAAVQIIMQLVYPGERQSTECVIRSIKGPFMWLDSILPAESAKRMLIITCRFHILNYRTRTVGFNHIRTTYSCAREEWKVVH